MKTKIKISLNYLFNFLSLIYVKSRSNNNFVQVQNSFFIPIVVAKFSPIVTPEMDPLIDYTFSMFILNLIVLACFFNIVGYIVSIYLIESYDLVNKLPSFNKYLKYYHKTIKILLCIEILAAFLILNFNLINYIHVFIALSR
jgi:hypothetical protein